MSTLTTQTEAIAAEARLASAMVELVVVHPRDAETIGLVADQIDGARTDQLNAGETALLVLDALAGVQPAAPCASFDGLGEVA